MVLFITSRMMKLETLLDIQLALLHTNEPPAASSSYIREVILEKLESVPKPHHTKEVEE
jgi:hypothetical protein